MTTQRDAGGEDVTAVLAWALNVGAGVSVRSLQAGAKLEGWFMRAATRWPVAWFDARRSPTALLWIASREAAIESFDADALALYDERAAVRTADATWPRSIAELLAVGDVLLSLGLIGNSAAAAVPSALTTHIERRDRQVA